MTSITPAKRRLVIALAVAVKNYAQLQKEAANPINQTILEGRKTRSEFCLAKASDSVYEAARYFDWGVGFVRVLRNAGVSEWEAYSRKFRLRAAFRRAVIKIAKRGGYWKDDLLSQALERDSR